MFNPSKKEPCMLAISREPRNPARHLHHDKAVARPPSPANAQINHKLIQSFEQDYQCFATIEIIVCQTRRRPGSPLQ
ncbi:hypothetical protein CCR91_15570 [Thiorhodovibrio winogradskyi]|nr:hypothetical protein [Thiorhodovibrio winogradskyi]